MSEPYRIDHLENQSMKDRISVDTSRCIGSGECVLAAPRVFSLDESGVALVFESAGPSDLGDVDLQMIMANCPSNALHLRVK